MSTHNWGRFYTGTRRAAKQHFASSADFAFALLTTGFRRLVFPDFPRPKIFPKLPDSDASVSRQILTSIFQNPPPFPRRQNPVVTVRPVTAQNAASETGSSLAPLLTPWPSSRRRGAKSARRSSAPRLRRAAPGRAKPQYNQPVLRHCGQRRTSSSCAPAMGARG